MSHITKKFKELEGAGRKAFIPYITAGDPDLETSGRLVLELERRGADIIELGVPFSDPIADGPVIQRASERALRNAIGASDCLQLVREIRKQSQVPIVLFSYLNPLLALGLKTLGEELRSAGIDGVIAIDMVPEEADEYLERLRPAGIDTIFLVAPTSTDERIELAARASTGFVYAVSRAGVTGVRESLSQAASSLVARIRRHTDLPVAVGFGISTPEQVVEIWRHADAAVVGSRLVAQIERCSGADDLVERVGELAANLVSGRKQIASGQ
jgi:tryptophan synthase alpha chain